MAFYHVNGAGNTPVTADEYLIESSSDLTNLPDCAPGSLAYTAAMDAIYQMDVDGTWTEITDS